MFLRVLAVLLGLIGLAGIGLALVALQRPVAVQEAAVLPPPPPPPPKVAILVAARPQRAGNLMTLDDITSQEVMAGKEPLGAYPDSAASRANLRGAMVRRSLLAGEPIVALDVLNPGDRGFLAAVLGAGMRAVTVAVDPVSGTAGLIWPGDRVDLVLTQEVDDRTQPTDRRVSGETVLTDLRVIAVDQQLVQGGQGAQANPTNVGNGNRTVTVEASLYDAQRVAVAARLGRISLVVRSAADSAPPGAGQTEIYTAAAPTAPRSPVLAISAPAPRVPPAALLDAPATAAPATPTLPTQAAGGHAPPAAPAQAPAAPAAADTPPPVAWAGDVSAAIRQRTGKANASIHLYHGPGTVDEVHF